MPEPAPRPSVGVSRCLLGDRVRFDGGHKRDGFLVDSLTRFVDLVPVCPEVEIGLPIPRPPIRLVRDGERLRVLGVRDGSLDVTERLEGFYGQVAERLADVCGFVVKRASPSCGLARVKVYDRAGALVGTDSGRFTAALRAARPHLPVEEEGRLTEPRLRESFVTRVFATWRWRALLPSGPRPADLQRFHARHKLLLLAHNEAAYRRLGPLVAGARAHGFDEALRAYEAEFFAALARRTTPRSHANVLQHAAGYLKRALDAGDRAELADAIDRYRLGLLPRVAPLTLLRHHLRRHPDPYLAEQVYLAPHPSELMLEDPLG